jgi:hypothetical protein
MASGFASIVQAGMIKTARDLGDRALFELEIVPEKLTILCSAYSKLRPLVLESVGQWAIVMGRGSVNNKTISIDPGNITILEQPAPLSAVTLCGYVGSDLHLRKTKDDRLFVKNAIAINDGSRAHWFKFIAWDRKAEIIERHVQKGGLLAITGKIRIEEYGDTICHCIAADNVHLMPQSGTKRAAEMRPIFT